MRLDITKYPINACLAAILASIAASAAAADHADAGFLPADSLNPKLAAPIDTWDEAIPLGNGLLGGLLWGRDGTIRLSLDRGDLWDLRVQDEFQKKDCTWKTLRRLVAEKNQAELVRRFDAPYNAPWPTKLPGGRLELSLDPSRHVASFTLDLARAVGRIDLGNGAQLETFFSAAAPVALMRIPGPPPKEWKLIAPGVGKSPGHLADQSLAAVQALGYPPAKPGADGNTKWFVQESVVGFRYAVVASARRDGEATLLAVTITTSNDGPDPLALGRQRLAGTLHAGYAKMLGPHEAWWRAFWQKSRVALPESKHLQQYYLAQYFYGSASRLGRRRCRCRACGRPTTAACRPGRAIITTT